MPGRGLETGLLPFSAHIHLEHVRLGVDGAAQAAHELGIIRDPSPDALLEALKNAWISRISFAKASGEQAKQLASAEATQATQDAAFKEDAAKKAPGEQTITMPTR